MSIADPLLDSDTPNPSPSTGDNRPVAPQSQPLSPRSAPPPLGAPRYSDAIHHLVDAKGLGAIGDAARLSDLALERVPSAQEVSTFFKDLNLSSDIPLSSRLTVSPREGSVALEHQWTEGSDSFKIILSTVTSDYTRRSLSRYSSRWHNVQRVGKTHLIPRVCERFNAPQKLLLEQQDPFLHQVVEHNVFDEATRTPITVYTVETTRRYKRGREPVPMDDANIEHWKHQSNFTRRVATPFEATIWAVANIVKPKPKLDKPRLQLIRDVIKAYRSDILEPQELPFCINMYELLKSRPAMFRDGRARYPILRGLVYSQSVVQSSEYQLERLNVALHTPVTVPAEMPTHGLAATIVVLTLLTSSLGLLYLLRLHGMSSPQDQEAVVSNALTIVFGMLSVSFVSWTFILTRSIDPSFIFRRHRAMDGEDLYSYTLNRSLPEKLFSLAMPASVAHYNGDWINFSGERYSGEAEYPARFHTSDLMEAAYQTTVCMDGREALLTPDLSSRVRMRGICRHGRAVFGRKEQEKDETSHVVIGARVVWRGDVEIGRSKDLL